ncbi:ABC transporter ATP-binding protein [Methylobacterium variabile]|uniref:ABC transporter ATP-binding protein n=1 Tax=Methylobacterium variabile TaxID=298794 RepID=A0A0J6UZ73_9HYPH|nr:ABC transporter ATP-binding protein [Methylobacterium variabile]
MRTYWREARWTTLLVVGATLVGALAAVAAPYLFSRAVDALTGGSDRAGVLRLLLLYALLFGVATAFGQAARFLVFLCAERLSYIANAAFFSRLLRKTPAFFLDHNPVEIGNARQAGAQTINIVAQLAFGGLLPGLVQIAVGAALVGSLLSWETAAIVLVYGAVVIGLDYLRVGRVRPFLDAAMARSQENARLVGNAVALVDTLRQTRGEAWITGLFAAGAGETFANWRRYALASSAFCGALGLAATVQLAATFLLLVPRHEAGLLTVGDIVLFNTLLLQLNEPFRLIGMAIKETTEAAARFRPLARMWTAPEEVAPADPLAYPASDGTIAFEAVAFRYPNGRGVADLSFVARRGTPTFLVGETGSGKSTVLKLLLKGLAPTRGRILVDGVDLARVPAEAWFAHVGVVPQEVVLLNDSLAANIVLGRPFDAGRLRAAAERASILARIEAMAEGFDTVVGERGLKLSGGERQRIAIARALYGEPSILILDEASSALDEDTERQVMDGLRRLADRLTIVAATHRTTSIRAGDQVVGLAPAEARTEAAVP